MLTIWNKQSGEARTVEAVDAREMLKSSPELYTRDDPHAAKVLPPPPPPPPAAVDPLANLPANWREQTQTKALRELAERVSGRTPEDRKQAVEMIDAALAKT